MRDERVQEIRERLSKATPGPWDIYRYRHGGGRLCVDDDQQPGRERSLIADLYNEGDRELLYRAPTDLADLLAEREKLLAVVEKVETLHCPIRVYDECDHQDCEAEQIEVYDYRACADSQIGWGCQTCCYDDDMPIEDCPHGADHQGVAEADSCPTHAAVRAYRATTGGQ